MAGVIPLGFHQMSQTLETLRAASMVEIACLKEENRFLLGRVVTLDETVRRLNLDLETYRDLVIQLSTENLAEPGSTPRAEQERLDSQPDEEEESSPPTQGGELNTRALEMAAEMDAEHKIV